MAGARASHQATGAPNWVRPGVVMDFTGQQVTTIPGAGSIPSPYGVRAVPNPTARTCSIDTLTSFLNGINTSSALRTTGVGQFFGGMWLPREALAVDVLRTGGDNLAALNQLPELPTIYLPLAVP